MVSGTGTFASPTASVNFAGGTDTTSVTGPSTATTVTGGTNSVTVPPPSPKPQTYTIPASAGGSLLSGLGGAMGGGQMLSAYLNGAGSGLSAMGAGGAPAQAVANFMASGGGPVMQRMRAAGQSMANGQGPLQAALTGSG